MFAAQMTPCNLLIGPLPKNLEGNRRHSDEGVRPCAGRAGAKPLGKQPNYPPPPPPPRKTPSAPASRRQRG